MYDGVGSIFTRHYLQTKPGLKVGTWRTKNRQFITVKYVIDPPKWADNDQTDWTMKTTARD